MCQKIAKKWQKKYDEKKKKKVIFEIIYQPEHAREMQKTVFI